MTGSGKKDTAGRVKGAWTGKDGRPVKKAVTFSYDDGVTQDRRLVEIFHRYGLKCTFNLNTGIQSPESHFSIVSAGNAGTAGNAGSVEVKRMPQEGLPKLYAGHEVAVHGLTHRSVADLSRKEILAEFGQDVKNIERLYGKAPVGMAYPYGSYSAAAIDVLTQIGIRYARTTESSHAFALPKDPMRLKPTCHHADKALFSLAEQFLSAAAAEPMLFYVWGHSYEFDLDGSWDRMEEFCRLVSGRTDIFYGTNKECLL